MKGYLACSALLFTAIVNHPFCDEEYSAIVDGIRCSTRCSSFKLCAEYLNMLEIKIKYHKMILSSYKPDFSLQPNQSASVCENADTHQKYLKQFITSAEKLMRNCLLGRLKDAGAKGDIDLIHEILTSKSGPWIRSKLCVDWLRVAVEEGQVHTCLLLITNKLVNEKELEDLFLDCVLKSREQSVATLLKTECIGSGIAAKARLLLQTQTSASLELFTMLDAGIGKILQFQDRETMSTGLSSDQNFSYSTV